LFNALWGIGLLVVVVGSLGLLLVVLKKIVERPERAHALYKVDEAQATYLYSYVEFRRLPDAVRRDLLKDPNVVRWYTRESHRHGGDMVEAFGTRFGKTRYRFHLWVINFLT